MFGEWEVNVSTAGMPEQIATAMGDLKIFGAEYEPIAYLGSQVVNGVNHAVLAEQTLTVGRDVKNIVLVIFSEKEGTVTLSDIERVVESGGRDGGIEVDPKTDIPAEAMAAFRETFEGFVGLKVEPFALLGTQVVKGVNYIFAAEVTPVTEDPTKSACLVTVNSLTKNISFVDILTPKMDVMSLGYAYTWMKRQNTSTGRPLGEWP